MRDSAVVNVEDDIVFSRVKRKLRKPTLKKRKNKDRDSNNIKDYIRKRRRKDNI